MEFWSVWLNQNFLRHSCFKLKPGSIGLSSPSELVLTLGSHEGFPGGSDGKESVCNARDLRSIPGSGRSLGEWQPTPVFLGFPCGSAGKESTCNIGDLGSIPESGRSLGEWQPTLVFLPREFNGQRSLAGYSPWGHRESDMFFFW